VVSELRSPVQKLSLESTGDKREVRLSLNRQSVLGKGVVQPRIPSGTPLPSVEFPTDKPKKYVVDFQPLTQSRKNIFQLPPRFSRLFSPCFSL
jgi:hypothetical protein